MSFFRAFRNEEEISDLHLPKHEKSRQGRPSDEDMEDNDGRRRRSNEIRTHERCSECGSYAINPRLHPRRSPEEELLCDVCMYRTRAEAAEERVRVLEDALGRAQRALVLSDCDYYSAPMIDGWEWYDAANMIASLLPDAEWTKQFLMRKIALTGGKGEG